MVCKLGAHSIVCLCARFSFGIAQKLNLHSQVLRRLLTHVEDNYCFDTERPNSYHNALHAAFVVQAVGHFMSACSRLLVGRRMWAV